MRAIADERRDANDRVVSPVMRFAELPEVQSRGEERPVHRRRELLDARVQRVAPGGARRRLDDSGVGIRLADAHERRQAFAAHHAVGIEHDHVAVLASPAAAEVGDVAALALDPVLSPAIEDAAEAVDGAAERKPGIELGDARIGVAGVGQDEKVEPVERAGLLQRLVRRAQSREHARHVFVADRHDDRGARFGWNRRGTAAGHPLRDRVTVATPVEQPESGERGPESGGYPCEQHAEEHEHGDLDRSLALIREHDRHVIRRDDRLHDDQRDHDQAAMRGAGAPAASRIARLRSRAPLDARLPPTRVAGRAGLASGPRMRRHRASRKARRRFESLAPMDIARDDIVGMRRPASRWRCAAARRSSRTRHSPHSRTMRRAPRARGRAPPRSSLRARAHRRKAPRAARRTAEGGSDSAAGAARVTRSAGCSSMSPIASWCRCEGTRATRRASCHPVA